MGYYIWQVLYETNWGRNKEDHVATYAKKRIPGILEEHIRKKMEGDENSRETKDIGVKILRLSYTGYKADKEGVIGCSFDELIMGMEIQKK